MAVCAKCIADEQAFIAMIFFRINRQQQFAMGACKWLLVCCPSYLSLRCERG